VTKLTDLSLEELERRYNEEWDHVWTGVTLGLGVVLGVWLDNWWLLLGVGLFFAYRAYKVWRILYVVKVKARRAQFVTDEEFDLHLQELIDRENKDD